MNKTFQALGYLFLTALLGASLGIAGKLALEYFDRKVALMRRAIFSFLFLLPFVFKSIKLSHLGEWQFWLLGLTSLANICLYMYGVQYTTAGMAQLMYLSIPLSTLVLSLFILNSRPGAKQIIGMIICSIGVLMLQSKKIAVSEGVSIYGNLIILLAASMHALYIVLSKKYEKKYGLRHRVGSFMLTSLSLPILLPTISHTQLSAIFPLSAAVFILLFGGISSLGLHLMTQATNQKFGTFISSCVLYIQPILGVCIAYLILGEKISWFAIIGGLITMCGAFLISKQK